MSSQAGPGRIILTSNGLTSQTLLEEFQRLMRAAYPEKKGGEGTMVYVATAAQGEGWSMDQCKANGERLAEKLGFKDCIVPDLTNSSFSVSADLPKTADVQMIYMECGNTFYLQYYANRCGVDEYVAQLMKQGSVYVGASAGSIYAGKTVQIALWKGWDDPTVVPANFKDEKVSKGLNIASGMSVFPHYNPKWKGLVAKKSKDLGHELIVLADDSSHGSLGWSSERGKITEK